MNLTLAERLIISNQFKILEKLYPEEAEFFSTHRTAVENGYKLHYDDLVENFFDEMPEEESLEILEILSMYRALTFSHQKLKDKSGIKADDIRFKGFDGNEETSQYLYTKFFILELGRFDELRYGNDHPDFNSHFPMLNQYRDMLRVWNSFEKNFNLNEKQILAILRA